MKKAAGELHGLVGGARNADIADYLRSSEYLKARVKVCDEYTRLGCQQLAVTRQHQQHAESPPPCAHSAAERLKTDQLSQQQYEHSLIAPFTSKA
jgi:hypothetical protein